MRAESQPSSGYRGRLAPSPTGYLHRGHAHTFSLAAERARASAGAASVIGEPPLAARRGKLFLRIDNLDRARCRPEFTQAAIADLRALGLHWEEPIIIQSQRLALYRQALERLHAAGLIYPCTRTRREIRAHATQAQAQEPEPERAGEALHQQVKQRASAQESRQSQRTKESPAPPALRWNSADEQDREPLFPVEFRPTGVAALIDWQRRAATSPQRASVLPFPLPPPHQPIQCNWRFLTPEGESLRFVDSAQGEQRAIVGRDLGDFLVWRKDDLPSYQLACVVDDIAMGITEVVRGADLLPSTFYQLLLYRALGATPPHFYHCELVRDATGRRLAKRHASRPLREY